MKTEKYLVAIKKIDGGLKKVGEISGMHPENVKRNLRGDTLNNSHVKEACVEMIREVFKEIQELLPDVDLV